SLLKDIELPAEKPRSQPRVLAFLADRHREILVGNLERDRPRTGIDFDVSRDRRLQRFRQHLLRILVITDDIDLFAAEFPDNAFHARPPGSDARSYRIDPRIVAGNRDFGPVTGFPR